MKMVRKLVLFHVHKRHFAIPLPLVERILPVMEMQPLPLAPGYIIGTINLQGVFLPVVDLRKLFLLPGRDLDPTDQFIVVCTSQLRIALWADGVDKVVECAGEEIAGAGRVLLDSRYVKGLVTIDDDLVLITDPDAFLTPDQVALLMEILEKQRREKEEGKGQRAKGKGQRAKGKGQKAKGR